MQYKAHNSPISWILNTSIAPSVGPPSPNSPMAAVTAVLATASTLVAGTTPAPKNGIYANY